jgi:hypothetical protein
MRPAYRVALLATIVLVALLGVGWLALGPRRAGPVAAPVLPVELGPMAQPAQGEGPPVTDMLDKLEAAEADRFGPVEAARRRRMREQLVHQRLAPTETP